MNTKGRVGKQTKAIMVYSNDPETPKLRLSIEGEVTAQVMVTPRSMWFGAVGVNEKVNREFTVKLEDPEKFKIKQITVEDKKFKVKKKGENPKGTFNYELAFLGSRKLDRITTFMNVEVEGVKNSPIKVMVRVDVVGDLRYTRYIRFHKYNNGFTHRDVLFSSRSGKKVRITKAWDPNKNLELSILEKGDNVAIQAKVADPERSYRPTIRGHFLVKTKDRNEPEIEIGYSISEPVPRPAPNKGNLNKVPPSPPSVK